MTTQNSLNSAYIKRLIFLAITATLSINILLFSGCKNDDDNTPPANNCNNNGNNNGNDDDDNNDNNNDTINSPVAYQMLTSGIQGGSGSTIGPDGALYVTEAIVGKVTRIDPDSGEKTTFAQGFPVQTAAIGVGGVVDIAFLNDTAYAIVTIVAPDVGGTDTVGLYRIDGLNSHTIVSDIGTFNIDNPPTGFIEIPTGVQYAMEPYGNGFLITDGHLNRVIYVPLQGSISIVHSFNNVVPTGLEVDGSNVFMTELGPAPFNPEDGKLVSFVGLTPTTVSATPSGYPMLVDVEYNSDHKLFLLSQGTGIGIAAGNPANLETGALVEIDNGITTLIQDEINRPTSFEFIDNTAYIITLDGEVWIIGTE